MKKSLITLLITVISIFVIGCGTVTPDKNKTFIKENVNECSKILFTCPQYEKPFSDDSGCGCMKLTDTKLDNPDSRTLSLLVKNYLVSRIFTPENKGGIILAEFATMGIKSLDKDETEVKYQVWAEIREYYYNDKEERTFKLRHRGPVILDLSQPGKFYIIHGYKLLDINDKELLNQELMEKGLKWMNDKQAFEATTKQIEDAIQQESDGTLIDGKIRVKLN